jgi:hypothetical protein
VTPVDTSAGLENYTAITTHCRLMGGPDIPKYRIVSLASLSGLALYFGRLMTSLASVSLKGLYLAVQRLGYPREQHGLGLEQK